MPVKGFCVVDLRPQGGIRERQRNVWKAEYRAGRVLGKFSWKKMTGFLSFSLFCFLPLRWVVLLYRNPTVKLCLTLTPKLCCHPAIIWNLQSPDQKGTFSPCALDQLAWSHCVLNIMGTQETTSPWWSFWALRSWKLVDWADGLRGFYNSKLWEHAPGLRTQRHAVISASVRVLVFGTPVVGSLGHQQPVKP